MATKNPNKKIKLAVAGRKTRWAPIWVVLKKHGKGKKIHPSVVTRHRRHWRRTKLRIQPIKETKKHLG
jgi:ribosomal protein L39E